MAPLAKKALLGANISKQHQTLFRIFAENIGAMPIAAITICGTPRARRAFKAEMYP
jgi:hypothetical protein